MSEPYSQLADLLMRLLLRRGRNLRNRVPSPRGLAAARRGGVTRSRARISSGEARARAL